MCSFAMNTSCVTADFALHAMGFGGSATPIGACMAISMSWPAFWPASSWATSQS